MLGCTKLANLFHASPWILFQEFLYVIESVIIIDMQGFFFLKKIETIQYHRHSE